MEKKILVIDIETTGFLDQGGSIVEVGMVALDLENGTVDVVFDSVCREDMLTAKHREEPMGWIFRNSSLTIEAVREAPRWEPVARDIQRIIDSYPLGCTAYNRQFDISFLESRGIRFGRLLPCPMIVSTNICKLPKSGGLPGYKWPRFEEAWAWFFPDIPYVEAHRGADDALHEAKLIMELYRLGLFEV